MLARNTLLAIGILAVVLGAVLAFVWTRQTNAVAQGPVVVPTVAVLVTSRQIPVGTLLRVQDLTWNEVTPGTANAGFTRGTATEADFAGAVTSRPLAEHQPLTTADFVKPGDRGFLVATLAPGDRAISIAVDAVQSESGLMLPGDRVDLVLTQDFTTTGNPGRRSVGETVLQNLRIIAVDQALASNPAPDDTKVGAAAGEPKLPKTITLEATEPQAQMILVADQLGKLQLTLRGRPPPGPSDEAADPIAPTWAADVSPALERLGTATPSANGASRAIEVIHGSKIERRCVSGSGLAAC
jgi:pilus assembly protein CpaB